MLRILVLTILLIFVLRALRSLWGGILEGLRQPSARGGVPSRGVQMVRDPVCGTFVIPERALSLSVGQDVVYFCSQKCRDAFSARPSSGRARVQGRTA